MTTHEPPRAPDAPAPNTGRETPGFRHGKHRKACAERLNGPARGAEYENTRDLIPVTNPR